MRIDIAGSSVTKALPSNSVSELACYSFNVRPVIFMKKRIVTVVCLFALILKSLSAELVSLKGANGNEAKFLLQSVSAEGISAQPQGSYKSMTLKWEQLDLEWLQSNQPDIWKQKLQLEALRRLAYHPFLFGQSRSAVLRQVNDMGAKPLLGETFGEAGTDVLWVCLDPKALRRFIRFSFDASQRVVGVEMHMNFDQDEDISKGMKAEWEQLIEMVEGYGSEPSQRDRFPSASTWRQRGRSVDRGESNSLVTHTWADELRRIELGFEVKQIDLSIGEAKLGKVTAFGAEADLSDVVSTSSRTSWVVYKATLK